MESVWIQKCRENFSSGVQRKNKFAFRGRYLSCETPEWLSESDELNLHIKNFPTVIHEGEVVWGHIVQANSLLFNEGDENHPGEVVYANPEEGDVSTKALGGIASRLFDLKGKTPDSAELKPIADYLTDEYIRVFGLQTPAAISPVYDCRISTTFFLRKHFPNQKLSSSVVPLVIKKTSPLSSRIFATVLPSIFWPEEMIEYWND